MDYLEGCCNEMCEKLIYIFLQLFLFFNIIFLNVDAIVSFSFSSEDNLSFSKDFFSFVIIDESETNKMDDTINRTSIC